MTAAVGDAPGAARARPRWMAGMALFCLLALLRAARRDGLPESGR